MRLKGEDAPFARTAVWAFVVRALGSGSGVVMNIAVTRSLGPIESGYFFLGLAVITFASSLSRLGLDKTLLRFIGTNAGEGNWGAAGSVFRQSFAAVFAASALAAAALWIASPFVAHHVFHKPLLAPTLRALAPGLVGLSLCFALSFTLQGVGRIRGAVFAQTIGIALGMMALSPWLATGVDAGHAYAISTAATVVVCYAWWRRTHPATAGTFPAQRLWDSALPLWIVTATNALQMWSGQFVAGAFVSPEDIARLAVAQRLALLTSLLLISVNLAVSPRFAALYQQGRMEDLRKLAQLSARMILLVTTPVIAVLILAARWIMSLYGPEFTEGAHLLRILAIGQFVNAATGSVGSLLIMSGHERDSRNIALLTGPFAVIVALVLTPLFGVEGAAVATALAVATQNLSAAYYVRKRLGFSTIGI